ESCYRFSCSGGESGEEQWHAALSCCALNRHGCTVRAGSDRAHGRRNTLFYPYSTTDRAAKLPTAYGWSVCAPAIPRFSKKAADCRDDEWSGTRGDRGDRAKAVVAGRLFFTRYRD